MQNHESYQKKYRLRLAQGKRKNSIEVTFPYEVIDKECRSRDISITEFLDKYYAIAEYNSFEGVHYRFEEIKSGGDL